MRGALNDLLRFVIGVALVDLGLVLDVWQRVRIALCPYAQRRLRLRYGIRADTPIRVYGGDVAQEINELATSYGEAVSFAETSGSTGTPKRILYPRSRVARARRAFIDAFARALTRAPLRRHSFYVFSSLRQDGSLTSLMLEETSIPSYFVTLQAPDRMQSHPELRALAERYGDVALRVWVLALSNPGILYSTNPSTLVAFLDAIESDWMKATALVRDYVERPAQFSAGVRDIERRLTSRGAPSRLRAIAESTAQLPLGAIAPGVHSYVCWTGGYVQPFLERLGKHLPHDMYRLLPMYSMSTETPETTPVYRGDRVSFVPLAPGVLFEFLPANSPDDPALLLPPDALTIGGEYTMVVSDEFGLTRYQTDDVFECVGFVSSLPDLRFIRRRTLSYSFTGEKLTGDQISMSLARVRVAYPADAPDAFWTCVPSIPGDNDLPRYLLMAVGSDARQPTPISPMAAQAFDQALGELNGEYRAKRESGRLGPIAALSVSRLEFLARVAPHSAQSWEAQFKFLPLYRVVWEQAVSRSSS